MLEVLLYVLLILFCLGVEGFFSGTETGLLSVNRIKLRYLMEKGHPAATFIYKTLEKPQELLATTLVGTNLAVVTGTAIATRLFTRLEVSRPSMVTSLVMTPLILLFGELIPKALFRRRADELVLMEVPLLRAAMVLLRWPAGVVGRLSDLLLSLIGDGSQRSTEVVSREELRHLIKMGGRAGVITPTQQRMLHRAFSFSDTVVKEVMIPLTEVVCVKADMTVGRLRALAAREGYTRYPVYEERVDLLIGYVNIDDVLFHPVSERDRVSAYLRRGLFVPGTVSIDKVLLQMQRSREPLAIVVDEYGGCDGIVTVDDILEEIVGEVDFSHEGDDSPMVKEGERTWIVDAHIDIDLLNEELGLSIPKGRYETLSGFLMARFERIPKVGEKLVYGGAAYEVLDVTPYTVQKVRISVDESSGCASE